MKFANIASVFAIVICILAAVINVLANDFVWAGILLSLAALNGFMLYLNRRLW